MQYRELGRTGWKVSVISFGAWAIGGAWGKVNEQESMAALHRAVDMGVNFFDTADVYGSERLLARLQRERKEPIYITTKVGRRLDPHVASGYNRKNLTVFVEDSLKKLNTERLDLVQLHCPPTAVYSDPGVYEILDDLVQQGKIHFYGVSVEKIDEALTAIQHPNIQTVQIVFNMFRQRPIEGFFPEAKRRQIGILTRLPLASGLLTGKMSRDTRFAADDHRSFNRHGESFDAGETFAGVDYEVGLQAVEELRSLVPAGMSMAQMALRWILMFDAVSCAIPGAKRPAQVEENCCAADFLPLSDNLMSEVRSIYNHRIRSLVHHLW
jgi:aryl-alcohol dehydrogenase-like predicted oxidoreductase